MPKGFDFIQTAGFFPILSILCKLFVSSTSDLPVFLIFARLIDKAYLSALSSFNQTLPASALQRSQFVPRPIVCEGLE